MSQQEITEQTLYAPVRQLAEQLRTRRITSTALTEAYLDRLRRFGERLGAVVTITRERALAEAREADDEIRSGRYRGPLHGIPYGVKDLLATRDIPTTWGAEPYRRQVFDYDATVVRKLRAAGAVLVAKLAMVELAGGFNYNNADASFTGPGRTPWNTEFWAGGSSSGSGAAVAAGLVAFAIGSETSGSILTPAAFCGVSGMRPTYGRVSRHGAMALSWTLDKLGPMCRSADCCGLVLAAIVGRDSRDPTTRARTFRHPDRPNVEQRFRIAVLRNGTNGAHRAVRENFEASLAVLRRFCDTVDTVDLPTLPFGDAVSTIIQAEAASAFRDLLESGRARELRAANSRFGGYAGMAVLAVDYLQAMRLRGRMKRALDELYARYDAIVAPSRATPAYPIGMDFDRVYPGLGGGPPLIQAGNVAGQPALSVPNGFAENRLPTGIQFTGRVWGEERLLALARAYQERTDWHTRRPPLADAPAAGNGKARPLTS
jgi:aspartyl-tRNA(Asn)/glutamyl-tRNA(Gln) amidotransferase subunit A